jgi:hypothetical protein
MDRCRAIVLDAIEADDAVHRHVAEVAMARAWLVGPMSPPPATTLIEMKGSGLI